MSGWPFARRAATYVIGYAQKALAYSYFHLEWEGGANIPRSGPLLVAANHLSLIDPAPISIATYLETRRWVRYLAAASWFRGAWGAYMRLNGAIPVGAGALATGGGLRTALDLLREERVIGIFPEGRRSPDGRLGPFQRGLAKLAAISGAPILPVTILGTWDLWPPGHSFPEPGPGRVVFHPPVRRDPREAEARSADDSFLRGIEDEVRGRIASAIPAHGIARYERGY